MKNLIILLIFCYFLVSCQGYNITAKVRSISERNDYRCDGVSILTTYYYMDVCGYPNIRVGDTIRVRLRDGFPIMFIDNKKVKYRVIYE